MERPDGLTEEEFKECQMRGAMGAAILNVLYDKYKIFSGDAMKSVYEIIKSLDELGYEIKPKE